MLVVGRLANALVRLVVLLQQVVLGRQHVIIARTVILVILQVDLQHRLGQWNVDVLALLAVTCTLTSDHVIVLPGRNQLLQNRRINVGGRFIAHRIGAGAIAGDRLR